MHQKKSLGQHFLACDWVIDTLVKSAELSKKDFVLEVGPGTGVLTRALARAADKVIAVEKDEILAETLQKTLQKEKITNVEIITGDILKLYPALLKNCSRETTHYKLVSNIPYYLTARLLRMIFEEKPRPQKIVLTVQREVAERITASAPHINLLALSVQVFGTPRIVKIVPRTCFQPKPGVESAIIEIANISEVFFDQHNLSQEFFFRVLRAGFGQKRKVLTNSLCEFIEKDALKSALTSLGLSGLARPEELTPDQWGGLVPALYKNTNAVLF